MYTWAFYALFISSIDYYNFVIKRLPYTQALESDITNKTGTREKYQTIIFLLSVYIMEQNLRQSSHVNIIVSRQLYVSYIMLTLGTDGQSTSWGANI